jgi:hypothetical protein
MVVNESGAKEEIFSTVKNFAFQEVTITVRSNAYEIPVHSDMPHSYTFDDIDAKSVMIKTSGN